MAAKKYLKIGTNSKPEEVVATVVSAGAANAGDIPALDDNGQLDNSTMPNGVGVTITTCPASEALSAGNWVNVWNDSGTLKARKADATTTGKEANGYVLAAVSSGGTATVYRVGKNSQLSGLTLDAEYFLSTTPGSQTTTAPSSAGNVSQSLGKAESTTTIVFDPGVPYKRA